MGSIVVTEFISLDGVIEAPGGGEKYKHGGWSSKFSRGEEGDKFKLDEARMSAALLLGRARPATLPADARSTGYRLGQMELYLSPSDQDEAIDIVAGSAAERWPRVEPMRLCA